MKHRKDSVYTGGVIAVKEKSLLGDKLLRFCSMGTDEAFRALLDSGFGGGEAESASDLEKLLARDSADLDEFIRAYAPNGEAVLYLLAPRDFHNAKALVKAEHLGLDPAPMLAGDGTVPASELNAKLSKGGWNPELESAVKEAKNALSLGADGAEIGRIFEKATYSHLNRVLQGSGILRTLFSRRADMTNLLTAFRSENEETALKTFVAGGTLSEKQLLAVRSDNDSAKKAFYRTDLESFVAKLCEARENGQAYTEAEKELASAETSYFYARRFDLKEDERFLCYVFRRLTENENVRIVFVCLAAGMKEADIEKRLRG